MREELSEHDLEELSRLIAQTLGLHFPRERWPELKRGIISAAEQVKKSPEEWVTRLCSGPGPGDLRLLAKYLTVGETYFFRDPKALNGLKETVIPRLLQERRSEQILRFWSAGCCSGEEAYTLAMLVEESVPKGWQVQILGTDINPEFLAKAQRGIYGPWSFRNVPEEVKQRYFRPCGEQQLELLPELKRMVRFEYLNLAEDGYPSIMNGTAGMDVILCRNVLIYFQTRQINQVGRRIFQSLRAGGYLLLGPSETAHQAFRLLSPVWIGETLFYQKVAVSAGKEPASVRKILLRNEQPARPTLRVREVSKPSQARIVSTRQQAASRAPGEQGVSVEKVRRLANEGRLEQALSTCELLLASDKLTPVNHYLHAMILEELGRNTEARGALTKAVYLDPGFVVVHFALANLARREGREGEARKHLENTRRLAGQYDPEAELPESGGLSAGRMVELASAMLAGELQESGRR